MIFSTAKLWLISALTILGLLLGAFFIGRASAPVKTVEKEITVTNDKSLIEQNAKLQESLKRLSSDLEESKKHVHTEVVTIVRKDGTFVTKKTEDKTSERTVVKTEVEYRDRVVTETKVEYRDRTVEVYKEKLVESAKPQWKASLLVGTQFDQLRLDPVAPYVHPLVLGVHVERRIVGPFFLGIWGSNAPGGGLAVGAEF